MDLHPHQNLTYRTPKVLHFLFHLGDMFPCYLLVSRERITYKPISNPCDWYIYLHENP